MDNLFNISQAANIAIHSMAMIANCKESLSAAEIARKLSFSRNHVSKVLQELSRANLISSTRGPKGGFVLSSDPALTSVFNIMELIDGKMDAAHCRSDEGLCPFKICVYGDKRQQFYVQFKEFYSKRTIIDFILENRDS